MIAALLLAGSAAAGAGADGGVHQVLQWFKIDETWKLWLVVFGLAGQAVFFARWVIQWIASERRGESHVPDLFWWCSLVGASMLFIYFAVDRDLVGMLGQSVGWMVYSRNLYLIGKKRRSAGTGVGPAAQPPGVNASTIDESGEEQPPASRDVELADAG